MPNFSANTYIAHQREIIARDCAEVVQEEQQLIQQMVQKMFFAVLNTIASGPGKNSKDGYQKYKINLNSYLLNEKEYGAEKHTHHKLNTILLSQLLILLNHELNKQSNKYMFSLYHPTLPRGVRTGATIATGVLARPLLIFAFAVANLTYMGLTAYPLNIHLKIKYKSTSVEVLPPCDAVKLSHSIHQHM